MKLKLKPEIEKQLRISGLIRVWQEILLHLTAEQGEYLEKFYPSLKRLMVFDLARERQRLPQIEADLVALEPYLTEVMTPMLHSALLALKQDKSNALARTTDPVDKLIASVELEHLHRILNQVIQE